MTICLDDLGKGFCHLDQNLPDSVHLVVDRDYERAGGMSCHCQLRSARFTE
jgi:hypothetical protein